MVENKKQPALHMMIGDYFKDPLLGQASLISRGAWSEILMYMWECDRRGELNTTPRRLMKLIRAESIEETLFFLNEIADLEFGDLEATDPENELDFPLTLADCNTKVTLRNRRMYSEFKDRQNTRLRVKKFRETKKKRQLKRKCNGNVTPSSSISISITKDISKDISADEPLPGSPKKSKHLLIKYQDFTDQIKDAVDQILKLQPKNGSPFHPWKWIQQKANENGHPIAVLDSLCGLISLWDTIDNPWGYANKIFITKNPNYNERDHIVKHEETKLSMAEIVAMPEFKNLSKNLLREM